MFADRCRANIDSRLENLRCWTSGLECFMLLKCTLENCFVLWFLKNINCQSVCSELFSLDYSEVWPNGLNVSILFGFPAARWLAVLPKRDYSPGWHSSWDLPFNTRDHQHLPKQVIPLYFLFCMAFLCQLMFVYSTDLKLVFQRHDVLFLKKNNLIMSSAWVFPVFISFSPCVVCFPVGTTGIGYASFPQGCADMEYRETPHYYRGGLLLGTESKCWISSNWSF